MTTTMNTIQNTIEDVIANGTDQEVLFNFTKFLERIGIESEFVQNEDGYIVGQVLKIRCGEYSLTSAEEALSWPLQPVAVPEEMKGNLN